MRSTLVFAALLAAAALTAAGCGGSESENGPVAFDQAFIDAMVPHHEAAIEMAQAAQTAGLREPELVRVATAIVATQQREIDDMRAWRADWFGSADIDPEGAAALGLSAEAMGMGHDAGALADSADPDADFAAMMVDHHAGAITMAELALERSEREEVRELAGAIIEAQSREIAVLERHAGMHHGG